jgi:AraC family transcriptional regulator
MEIAEIQLPARRVAYVRHFGEYGLQPTLRTLKRLLRWAGSRGLLDAGRVLGIPWNNPRVTPAEDCCYDACIEVPDHFEPDHPAIGAQTLEAGTYLVRSCNCVNGDLETPWQEFLAWYRESPWEMTDEPCFEVYLERSYLDDSGNWTLELYMPVHPQSMSAATQ